MKKIYRFLLAGLVVLSVGACELDLQDSPNVLSPDNADLDFLLHGVQLELKDVFNTASNFGEDVMRMRNMFGQTYSDAYAATSFDGIWENAYSDLMVDANTLIELGKEREYYHHSAIAHVAKAYTMVTLVDMFGDVPYSEALDADILQPVVDGGASIYAAALVELDSAAANFAKTPLVRPTASDLYYGGTLASWGKMMQTLRLKILLQTRLVQNNATAINAIIDADSLIDDNAEAFVFRYGTSVSAPDARNPDFVNNYVGGASDYMSNFYMDIMYNEKSIVDPRMRYYFYRQTLTVPTNPQILPCINRSAPAHYPFGTAFCSVGDGYWGRDHLDDDGIPPDNLLRTIWGVYPAGGAFDEDQGVDGSAAPGYAGAGIEPILMPAFTHFMIAEFELAVNTDNAAARAALQAGIEASMSYVISFGASQANGTGFESTMAGNVVAYVNEVLADYDAAATNAARMQIIMKEYYLAAFGNGLEIYNTARRTGLFSGLQPSLLTNPGQFYNSFTYPNAFSSRNINAPEKTNSTRVFWDNGTVSLN